MEPSMERQFKTDQPIKRAEKIAPAPEMLLEEFNDVVDERGFVRLGGYREKEPASVKLRIEEIYKLHEEIQKHPDISAEEKEAAAERMEKARDFLEEKLQSGR